VKKILLLNLCVMYFVSNVFAAPVVSSANGDIEDGVTITISGIDFGNKIGSAALCDYISEIENGQSGETVSLENCTPGSLGYPKYSSKDSHSGSQSVVYEYNNQTSSFVSSLFEFDPQDKVYFTVWVKLDKQDALTRFQWKTWRLDNMGTYLHNDGPQVLHNTWWQDGRWFNSGGLMTYYDNGVAGCNEGTPNDAFVIGEWMRLEGYYQSSSEGGLNDGKIWVKRIGRDGNIFETETAITHGVNEMSEEYKWRYLLLGVGYSNHIPLEDSFEMNIFYDDIYVDNSLARVEIGDNPDFDSCTHREIQSLKEWGDNSLTVKINKGSFNEGENAYLFVVDDNGLASEGYPITIGESSSMTFDVNVDGQVNVIDVIMCVNIVIGHASGNADVNEDGQTNVQDVTALVNEILGN